MLMRQSTYIFGGAVTGLLVASVTLIGEHDAGAFSSFAQQDLRSEQAQEPCPIKEASKKEIMRLAKIEMPALPHPEEETPAESCALAETGWHNKSYEGIEKGVSGY